MPGGEGCRGDWGPGLQVGGGKGAQLGCLRLTCPWSHFCPQTVALRWCTCRLRTARGALWRRAPRPAATWAPRGAARAPAWRVSSAGGPQARLGCLGEQEPRCPPAVQCILSLPLGGSRHGGVTGVPLGTGYAGGALRGTSPPRSCRGSGVWGVFPCLHLQEPTPAAPGLVGGCSLRLVDIGRLPVPPRALPAGRWLCECQPVPLPRGPRAAPSRGDVSA